LQDGSITCATISQYGGHAKPDFYHADNRSSDFFRIELQSWLCEKIKNMTTDAMNLVARKNLRYSFLRVGKKMRLSGSFKAYAAYKSNHVSAKIALRRAV
jgi:hypothetical protein